MREKLAAFLLFIFPGFPEWMENRMITSRIKREKKMRRKGQWPAVSED